MCAMTTNEYGVSEVIGFILILGIVITGMGLVTLYGYPILLKEQQNANIKNMERNMIVLQNEVKGLAYKSVPYRETTMQITGGTLGVVRPNCPTCSVNDLNLPGQSYFNISKSGTNIPFNIADPGSTRFYPGLLLFESSPTAAIIGLQNGAVVTNGFSDTGGSTMLSDPRWFLDDVNATTPTRTLVLSMIQISADEGLSKNGIGNVQMGVSELYPPQDIALANETVAITYFDGGEGYSTAWQNYFNDPQVFTTTSPYFAPCSVTGSALTIPDVSRIIIKTYKIDILSL
jgi:hypothetical protein